MKDNHTRTGTAHRVYQRDGQSFCDVHLRHRDGRPLVRLCVRMEGRPTVLPDMNDHIGVCGFRVAGSDRNLVWESTAWGNREFQWWRGQTQVGIVGEFLRAPSGADGFVGRSWLSLGRGEPRKKPCPEGNRIMHAVPPVPEDHPLEFGSVA